MQEISMATASLLAEVKNGLLSHTHATANAHPQTVSHRKAALGGCRAVAYIGEEVGEEPEGAAKNDPGGKRKQRAHEQRAQDENDERHGAVHGAQLDRVRREREHAAQHDSH